MLVEWAGVAQLAERLLPKQDVVGSSPIARSYPAQCAREGNGCTRHVPSGSSFLVPCCPYGHELLNNGDAISAISYDALDAATEPFQATHPGESNRHASGLSSFPVAPRGVTPHNTRRCPQQLGAGGTEAPKEISSGSRRQRMVTEPTAPSISTSTLFLADLYPGVT